MSGSSLGTSACFPPRYGKSRSRDDNKQHQHCERKLWNRLASDDESRLNVVMVPSHCDRVSAFNSVLWNVPWNSDGQLAEAKISGELIVSVWSI